MLSLFSFFSAADLEDSEEYSKLIGADKLSEASQWGN